MIQLATDKCNVHSLSNKSKFQMLYPPLLSSINTVGPYGPSGGDRDKQPLLFINTGQKHFFIERVTGQFVFFAIISYRVSRFLCKHLSLSCHMVNFSLILIHQ